eukprot:3941296-Rhodomonas_salina.6
MRCPVLARAMSGTDVADAVQQDGESTSRLTWLRKSSPPPVTCLHIRYAVLICVAFGMRWPVLAGAPMRPTSLCGVRYNEHYCGPTHFLRAARY